ncbi:MAG: hypothetical protein CVU56_29045 [Deltaproteobacteria bacterium HGW-Deltaproteobacteria-14]|nr:MAG: hypothetical protein CVU56_29045 [Deltaproteobacteria bacterium HGW-Deltaproteobacteria-14]
MAVALGCAALLAAGCESDGETGITPWREALPDLGALYYAFPDVDAATAAEASAPGVQAAPLVGAESELYAAGRDATKTVNRAIDAYLVAAQRVMRNLTPRRVSDSRVVWRGIAPNALDEDLLVVQRADDGHFEYALWSRDQVRAEAQWRFRLYGSTTPVDGARRGRGVLWVDLEGDRLPGTRGKVLALWENLRNKKEVAVTFFAATTDEDAPARTRSFIFQRSDSGNLMAFGPELVDVHDTPDRAALEEVRLLTRWTSGGSGRSDATVTAGDVAARGYAVLFRTECWASPDHAVRYEATAVRARTNAGAGPLQVLKEDGDRAACPLAEPETAVVPSIGDEPEEPALPPEASEPTP